MTSLSCWILREQLVTLDKLVVQPHSVVSLLLPPKANLNVVKGRIKEEYGKASNIKSATNRSSVQESLKGVGDHLQGIRAIPANGLGIYFGSHVVDPRTGEAGKLRRMIEPPFPVQDLVYSSDNYCVTAPLWKLLNLRQGSVGYVIVDGSQATIAVVSDCDKEIRYNESVILPRKHGRGGQSAARFGRIRLQARQLYLKKVSEKVSQLLLKDSKPEVSALVVAGSGYLKDDLVSLLNPSLQKILKKVVSIAYGGEPGLDEAIENARDLLSEMNLDENKKSLEKFFEHLKMGENDMISYGEENVRTAIEAGAVSCVLVWDESDFVHWLIENCPEFKTEIQIVKNATSEFNMLVKTFCGVCAFHRYSFTVPVEEVEGEDDGEVFDY